MLRRVLCGALLITASGTVTLGKSLADEPAQIRYYHEGMVDELIKKNAKEPVLLASAGNKVLAIVYADSLDKAREKAHQLLARNDVKNCAPDEGAVQCCDASIKRYRVHTVDGWLDIGESCNSAQHAAANGEEDASRVLSKPTPSEPVSDDLWRELEKRFGIDYFLMQLAAPDGSPRLLVHRPNKRSDFPQVSPAVMDANDLKYIFNRSNFMLSGHKMPTPLNGCVSTSISYCKRDNNKRCRKEFLHWYEYVDGMWCQLTTTCTCP